MKVFIIAQIEIRKSLKGVLKLALFMAVFVILITTMFDPELFAGMEEMLSAYPEIILEMIGSTMDIATYRGFYTMEFLSMIWIWLGIYFILQAGQDIPSTIENKTIDLIISKPLKRWEFVLGRYMRFVFSIFFVMLFIGLITFLLIAFMPNLENEEINLGALFWGLVWAWIFIVALTTTAFFCSTLLSRKKATAVAFTIIVLFFIVGTFYSFFDASIQDLKFLSLFYYYDPSRLIVSQDSTYVLRDFLILSGYSLALLLASITAFNKRDIPV